MKQLRLHAERAGWSAQEVVRATATKGRGIACIDFVAEQQHCPRCGGSLRIQKSKTRIVMTVSHGQFEAREFRKRCMNSDCPAVISETLRRLVKPGQRYAYDLIVKVGLSRYLEGKQREEIRKDLLIKHGIELSCASISTLCDRFLSLLEALHVHRAPQLRALLKDGYPMHIDATCERGKGGLFVSLDGWHNWVLCSGRIASENSKHLQPLVEKTVELFGNPIAVVRDMGEGMSESVQALRQQGIVDLICHYHFLRAIGDRLFNNLYDHLRGMIQLSRIRTDLRTLLRDLRPYASSNTLEGRFGPGTVRESLKALILWMLQSDGSKGLAFPFALPHFEFVQRCRQARKLAEQWIGRPRSQPERRAIRHLSSLVSKLERDKRLIPTIHELDERWRAFLQLRDVLRLSNAELAGGDARYQQLQLPALQLLRLEQIRQAVESYQAQLYSRVPSQERDKSQPSCAAAIILKYLKRYWAHLFGHPARFAPEGTVNAVVDRTNNVLEHLFGMDKHRLRRRLGRAHLSRELEQQPAQAALVWNLRNPQYVRVVCGTLENLHQAFAELEADFLVTVVPVEREYRDKQLQTYLRKLIDGNHGTAIANQHTSQMPLLPNIISNDSCSEPQQLQDLTEQELTNRCKEVFAVQANPSTPKPRDPRLPPAGSVLERWYKGRAYRVRVLDDGFLWGKSSYSSPTEVATAIKGKSQSGFDFFGLKIPWPQRAAQLRGRRINCSTLIDLPGPTEF